MKSAPTYKEEDYPAPGSVFFAPLEDGRFGLVRVVRTKVVKGAAYAFVVPSSWIGSSPLRPADAEIRRPLVLTHHAWKGWREAFWVTAPVPPSFAPAGMIALTAADDSIQQESYAGWESGPIQILLQWRWDHDRENLLREETAEKEKQMKEREAAREKREEMLRGVTLEDLAGRTWFESWNEGTEGRSLEASRLLVQELVRELAGTPKLTANGVRSLLKRTVKGFNQLDNQTHFVETIHREDICEALNLVMCAARHPDLVDEIDEWREW